MTDHAIGNTIDGTDSRPAWLPHHVWPYDIRTAHLDDDTIAYTDAPAGQAGAATLLFVHDGFWSFIWAPLLSELPGFRRVTLDFPGAGLSPTRGAAPSLAHDSVVLERLVDHLGLRDVTLVVHDLGGAVGLSMAARRPELIRGLVMVNTFAWPPDATGLRTMLGFMGSRPVTGLDVATNLVPRLSSTRFGVGRHLDREGRAALLGPFRDRGPRRRFHGLMAAARREHGLFEQIEGALRTTLSDRPVLTIFGERNDPFGFQPRFREMFPDAEELVIAGGNHFPMADDPELVATTIADWHDRRVRR